jgi:hypothetical protein
MPAHTWQTNDTITATLLNNLELRAAADPWQFLVEDYGAVGNGSTDDTAAINAAVADAVAYGQAHNQYAEVVFRDRTYLLSAATTKTTTNKGNAQIPLPVISTTTAPKLTLVFRGVLTSNAPPNFGQTPVQYSGTVL